MHTLERSRRCAAAGRFVPVLYALFFLWGLAATAHAQSTPSLSPTSAFLGSVPVGSHIGSQGFVFRNGSQRAVVTDVAITGANPGDFSVLSNGCAGQTLSPGYFCQGQLFVGFSPTQVGARSATLVVTLDNGQNVTADLTGSGTSGTPELTCPADEMLTANASGGSYSGPVGTATSTTPGAVVTGARGDGQALTAPYPPGFTTITWTATDPASGTSQSCAQLVLVMSSGALTCPGDVTVTAPAGQTAAGVTIQPATIDSSKLPAGVAGYVYGARSDGKGLGDPYPVGTTRIVWQAAYRVRFSIEAATEQCTQTIAVLPQITCLPDLSLVADSAQESLSAQEALETAASTTPGAVVAGVRSDARPLTDPYPVGKTTITWTASLGGQQATCTQTITVGYVTLTCPPDQTVTAPAGQNSASVSVGTPTLDTSNVPAGLGGRDISGNIGVRDDGKALADPYPVGTTTIFWTRPLVFVSPNGTYQNGTFQQVFSCTQKITVQAALSVDVRLTCPPNQTVTAPAGQNAANVSVGMPTLDTSRVPAGVSVVNGGIFGTRGDGKALTDPYPVGTTHVFWGATVDVGSAHTTQGTQFPTCTQTITVKAALSVDVRLACPPDETVTAAPGQTAATVTVGMPTLDRSRVPATIAVVNGGISGVRGDGKALADPYPVGTTTIAWEGLVAVGPANGDSTSTPGSIITGTLFPTCAQTITVLANTQPAPPTITCPPNQTLTAPAGQSSAAVTVGLATSPTAGATVVGVRSDGKPLTAPYPVGTTTITWSATDSASQTTICAQTISVLPAYTFTSVVIPPSAANPHLDALVPDHGPVDQRVILHGSGFADVQGTSYVTLAGQQIPVLSWTANAIAVVIDPTAYRQRALALNAAYPVQVVTPAAGKRSNTVDFFLTDGPPPVYVDTVADPGLSDQPVVAGFQRSVFCPGDTVALLGSGFGFVQGSGYVSVSVPLTDGNGHTATQEFLEPVLAWSENSIEIVLNLPAGAVPGSYRATVHRSNGKTASGSFILGSRDSSGHCSSQSPALTANPAHLTFAAQAVSTTSGAQNVTVMNMGSAPLIISSVTASAGFAAGSDCTGTPLAPGAACQIPVTFTPGSAGGASGTLVIQSNGGTTTVQLSGIGEASPATRPTITGLTCGGGNPIPVTITGTQFGASQGGGTVTLEGTFADAHGNPSSQTVELTVTSWSDTSLTVTLPQLQLAAGAAAQGTYLLINGSYTLNVNRDDGQSVSTPLVPGVLCPSN